MKVHGSCHCGAVRYEATVDPSKVTICHCADCQALTGAACRVTVPAPIDTFVLLAGTPRIYVKTGDSGERRAQGFCDTCGSPIYTHAADHPKMLGLRTGCIAERHALPPQRQKWCRSALPSTMAIDHLPKRERD